jgi:hypothetical protein
MAKNTSKRLKCEYDKPSNISQLANYFLNILTGLGKDPLFDTIAALIGTATTQVLNLQKAEVEVLTKVPGKAALRDVELLATNIIMDQVLSKIQEAGDADLENARVIFEAHQLKIVEHPRHSRGEMEVKHGKVSKTFIVRNKPVAKNAAYVWLISLDKLNWKLGTFAPKSSGIISQCGDDDLVPGKLYYVKSQSNVKGVFSDWSQVVEIICI